MTTAERDPNEQGDQVEDLDVTDDDAEAVMGGKMADPCEGGE